MEMFASMTMPEVFFTLLLVLVILGVALYVVIRLVGQRMADGNDRPSGSASRRDGEEH